MFCFMSMAGSLSDSSSVAHVLVAGDVHPPEAGEPGQLSRAQTSWKGFVPSQAHIHVRDRDGRVAKILL